MLEANVGLLSLDLGLATLSFNARLDKPTRGTCFCFRPQKKMSDRKAVIKNADMSEEMQQDAVDCATQALEKYNIEKVCINNMFILFYLLLVS